MYQLILLFTSVLSLAAAQNNRTARIVGGRDAEVQEIPYYVSLRAHGSTLHFCGGALLTNRWVVTAATCVYGRPRNSLGLVVGNIRINTGVVGRQSSDILIHHLFEPKSVNHNIALILSASAFPLNVNIRPIPISSYIIRDERSVIVSGFGATTPDGGPNSDILQVLETKTATPQACGEVYTELNFELNMCTSNEEGEGFCTSDLGGPLVYDGELIGISSWNSPCALGIYDLYVRISTYRLWIASITGV